MGRITRSRSTCNLKYDEYSGSGSMQYNPLGKTDLRVSRLCLGCMTFGELDRGNHAWTLPEESSRPIIKRGWKAA
ncbi:putative aldo/keto reductase [Escherichia albertii]|nr:putative aldo/keto reductase [Escherichia coli]